MKKYIMPEISEEKINLNDAILASFGPGDDWDPADHTVGIGDIL